jgi:hypothetical protein
VRSSAAAAPENNNIPQISSTLMTPSPHTLALASKGLKRSTIRSTCYDLVRVGNNYLFAPVTAVRNT